MGQQSYYVLVFLSSLTFLKQKGEKNEKDYQRIQLKKEREAKRKQFFLQQEEKLQARHLQLKQLHKQDEMARLKALEQKKIEREKNEIRREAEREKRRMDRMEREAVVRTCTVFHSAESKVIVCGYVNHCLVAQFIVHTFIQYTTPSSINSALWW